MDLDKPTPLTADLPHFESADAFPKVDCAALSRLLPTADFTQLKSVEAQLAVGKDDAAVAHVRELVQSGKSPGNLRLCLLESVRDRNERLAQVLVSGGAKFDVEVVKAAILNEALPLLSLLRRCGWDVNEPEAWCLPPLLSYAIMHSIEVGRILADAESNFSYAITKEPTDQLLSWFLENDADPNAICMLDDTPLSTAVARASGPVVKRLLAACPAHSALGGQLLHFAAGRKEVQDHDDILNLVLDTGHFDVNEIMYSTHRFSFETRKVVGLGTPLHEAAKRGRSRTIKTLLDHGAKKTILDTRNETAFQIAKRHGHHACAELLL